MKRAFLSTALLLLIASSLFAQQVVFQNVKVRRHKSPQDRVLVDKSGTLKFDDTAKKLAFRDDAGDSLDISYADVQKAVFEVTTHMRGGAMSQLVGGIPGAMMASKHVNDYWFYLEYKTEGGKSDTYLLEVEKDSSAAVIDKAKAVFGDQVTIAEFPQQSAELQKSTLKDLQSKHDLKVNRQNHPMPEMKADKALVMVVCPPLAARYAGQGIQFKLHANDQVIAVNKMGTYSFAYLTPGKYRFASQSENADGFEMEVEAGKDYYLMQNTFMGAWKAQTKLSRNTKELAMYEASGAYWSDWKRTAGPETGAPAEPPK